MKLLKTMTYPGFPIDGIETITREAARIVLVDEDGMVPLIYSSKMGVYKTLGGQIASGEEVNKAVKRELVEALGYEAKILGEIGEIVEQRPANVDNKGDNIVQSSYCYYGTDGTSLELDISKNKADRGFEIVRIHISKVLEVMQESRPSSSKAEGIKQRDIIIFKEYLKLKKGNS